MPGREPEAEHGRRGEGRHEVLRDEGAQAEAGGELHGVVPGQGGLEPLAARTEEQQGAHCGEREDRCPAQQPVVAVDGQGHDAVGAVGDVGGRERVGGRLAGALGGIGGRTPVEPVVHHQVEHDARAKDLGSAERQQAAVSTQ